MFKQDVIDPYGEKAMLLSKNRFEYFEDIKFAFFERPILALDPKYIRFDVLKSD